MPKRNKSFDPKAKWKGYTYEQKKEILEKIGTIHGLLRKLQNNVTHSDLDTDETYNGIFELVESLYGELDIHNLTLDNQRRWKEHKAMLRKKGLTDS